MASGQLKKPPDAVPEKPPKTVTQLWHSKNQRPARCTVSIGSPHTRHRSPRSICRYAPG